MINFTVQKMREMNMYLGDEMYIKNVEWKYEGKKSYRVFTTQ